MNYGLVLEGGAMRGLFTAGVIDVLMENEIEFAGAVGVSAGAALAAIISHVSREELFATARVFAVSGSIAASARCF